jgi:hypothetical protein
MDGCRARQHLRRHADAQHTISSAARRERAARRRRELTRVGQRFDCSLRVFSLVASGSQVNYELRDDTFSLIESGVLTRN